MKEIIFLLACVVLAGTVGAVDSSDELWMTKAARAWMVIEDGFATISDPASSRYDQYNANCNMRETANRALNDSRATEVSDHVKPAKTFFELAMIDIIDGSEYSEAALFCGDDFACIRANVSIAQNHETNFTTNIIQFWLLYTQVAEHETPLQNQIERQPSDRPTNSSATA